MSSISGWVKRVGGLLLCAVLAGCGIAQRVEDATRIDYQSAPPARKLAWPPDLVAPQSEAAATAGEATFSAFDAARTRTAAAARLPIVAAPAVLPALAGVRMERQGAQRWLVVDQPPEKVWPLLREFWLQAGFGLASEAPEIGVLETDWLQRRSEVEGSRLRAALARWLGSVYASGERDQFRTRLEAVGEGTEVFVAHRGMTETWSGPFKDTVMWVARAPDPELEAEYLRRLGLRLRVGASNDSVARVEASAKAVAQPDVVPLVELPERAVVRTEAGQAILWLQDAPERSWRQVALALDRLGFTVEDRDRSRGTFYLRYVDPEPTKNPQGLVQKVFGTGSKKDLNGRPYQLVLEASEGAGGTRVAVRSEQPG
jgi:outer membrane protein assembly factor BamC